MKKIPLEAEQHAGLTVMVFAEGTILKPKSWRSLYRHNSYVPIGNAVRIINAWRQQGANIIYCTSRRKAQAEDMASLLKKHGFRGLYLAARESGQTYADIVETIQPDILVEDNCKSVGGAWQMCITKVKREVKENIKSIVVPEFKGIDSLSTDVMLLLKRQ